MYLTISDNIFQQDTSRIMISGCSPSIMSLENNSAKRLIVDFNTDTLYQLSLKDPPLANSSVKTIKKFNFQACVLNGDIEVDLPQSNTAITFKRCRFNRNTQLVISDIDTLNFDNCISTEIGMQLKGTNKNKSIVLKFDNTDVTNIDFNYDEHFALHRWKDPDMTRSVYEKLLVKFQDEKRLESYKRVDIEYFKFRNNSFVNFLNSLWWNYGYDKWRIIVWTAFLLLFFTSINMTFWNDVVATYPIEKGKHITNSPAGIRFFKILVYTSLIFFSLKVDFDRLSFKNTWWLIYFFLQFCAGLWCLLFIFNAILKFSDYGFPI
jgi:hypothetical protein